MAKQTTKKDQNHTLKDLSLAFLQHLEKKGTSLLTRATYQSDLAVAATVLGETTKLATLTPKKVEAFYECEEVTKTKSGKAKAAPTIAKTRRVLRMALVWAAQNGWLEKAPVPDLKAKAPKAAKTTKKKASRKRQGLKKVSAAKK